MDIERGTYSLDYLQSIISDCGLFNRQIPFKERYQRAIQSVEIRRALDISVPEITDFTKVLQVEGVGKVVAIRMDLMPGVDNHKKLVVAGLILRGVLLRRIPRGSVDTFIDAGNFNSAKAVKFYADRFGIKGMYIMSYLFPERILDGLRSENFQIIVAPHKYDNAREREFYEYLFEQMRIREFSKNKFCLWHAKYGGEVMYPLGVEIAQNIQVAPDCTVSCLGAGSTLSGIQFAIQDCFTSQAISTVIAEHKLSPLMAKIRPVMPMGRLRILDGVKIDDDYICVDGLPHIAIGPHYDELNPLISQPTISRVDSVVEYSDDDWKAMQSYFASRGISVGNSSAANLCVAGKLANTGLKVVTIIFEPFRDFYKRQ